MRTLLGIPLVAWVVAAWFLPLIVCHWTSGVSAPLPLEQSMAESSTIVQLNGDLQRGTLSFNGSQDHYVYGPRFSAYAWMLGAGFLLGWLAWQTFRRRGNVTTVQLGPVCLIGALLMWALWLGWDYAVLQHSYVLSRAGDGRVRVEGAVTVGVSGEVTEISGTLHSLQVVEVNTELAQFALQANTLEGQADLFLTPRIRGGSLEALCLPLAERYGVDCRVASRR